MMGTINWLLDLKYTREKNQTQGPTKTMYPNVVKFTLTILLAADLPMAESFSFTGRVIALFDIHSNIFADTEQNGRPLRSVQAGEPPGDIRSLQNEYAARCPGLSIAQVTGNQD